MKLSRDPALYLAAFAAAVQLATAFGLHLTSGQQGVLNAAAVAIAGIVTALWVRHDGQVAAILAAIQAVLSVAVGFGAHFTPEQQAILMSFIAAGAAMFVRTQATAPIAANGTRQA